MYVSSIIIDETKMRWEEFIVSEGWVEVYGAWQQNAAKQNGTREICTTSVQCRFAKAVATPIPFAWANSRGEGYNESCRQGCLRKGKRMTCLRNRKEMGGLMGFWSNGALPTRPTITPPKAPKGIYS